MKKNLPPLNALRPLDAQIATDKRRVVYEWLTVAEAFSLRDLDRMPEKGALISERIKALKKFAASIRTSTYKMRAEWWLSRLELSPVEMLLEYLADRRRREVHEASADHTQVRTQEMALRCGTAHGRTLAEVTVQGLPQAGTDAPSAGTQ